MFGFSIGKLLVLAAILVVVVFGFKLLGRLGAPQRSREPESDSAGHIDTVYDPKTDSYVPKDSVKPSDKE